MKGNYSIDSIYPHEARYSQVGGLRTGISKGIRVEDTLNGIIVISLNERSQLANKQKCLEILEAYHNRKEQE